MNAAEAVRFAAEFLSENVATEIAATYDDVAVFPHQVVVSSASEWPGDVLLLATESQGVCSWGLSMTGESEGAVVVAGDLTSGPGRSREYCPDLRTFIETRRWDAMSLSSPLLQAQADPIDSASTQFLKRHFTERWPTYGWPCAENRRFERGAVKLMVWSCAHQCDWWVSGPVEELAVVLDGLWELSNLKEALWSNDNEGAALLDAVRG